MRPQYCSVLAEEEEVPLLMSPTEPLERQHTGMG